MNEDPRIARRREAAGLVRQAMTQIEAARSPEEMPAAHDEAIHLYQRARALLDPADRGAWGTVAYNLGVCFYERRHGNRAENLEQALRFMEEAVAYRDESNESEEWARAQTGLAAVLGERAHGDASANRERAIDATRAALRIRTAERLPVQRAECLNNLGNFLSSRIAGSRAENIEQAIGAFTEARGLVDAGNVEIRASVDYNLATALLDRVEGDRGENVERAIGALHESLTARPVGLRAAGARLALANAYGRRLHGLRGDNVEQAIALVDQVVGERPRARDAYGWASAQNSRGALYAQRVRHGRADNLEEAVASYRAALAVFTADDFPRDRAGTLNNLANVLRLRLLGDREANENEAIALLEQAASIFTRESDPFNWASTIANLGAAYVERQSGSANDNIDLAISCYQQALEVRTRDALPWDWSTCQLNIGQAYWRRHRGNRRDNLDAGRRHLEQALTIRTEHAAPEAFAAAISTLGLVLDEQAEHGDADPDDGLGAHRAALRVYSADAYPLENRSVSANLAGTLLRLDRPEEAQPVLAAGIRAAGTLFAVSPTEDGRQAEADDNSRLYQLAVEAALRNGAPAHHALGLAEAGRGRLLTDWLRGRPLPAPPGLPPELLDEERQLLDQARAAALGARIADEPEVRQQAVRQATATREHLDRIWGQIASQPDGSDYVSLRRGEPFTADALTGWLDRHERPAALAAFYFLRSGPVVFLARSGRAVEVIDPAASYEQVDRLLDAFDNEVATARGPQPEPETWTALGDLLLADVVEQLADVDVLYLVPWGRLHSVPWHAAVVDGVPLIDRFAVAYAPTAAAAVRLAAAGPNGAGSGDALVVGDPTGDLPHARAEAEAVAAASNTSPLLGEQATIAAVTEALDHVGRAHFAAHGYFDGRTPLRSGVKLADGTLAAGDLLARVAAPRTFVVSACESGRQLAATGDELWGLSRGLLYAGASTVIVTLWRVADLATRDLMAAFYTALDDDRLDPPRTAHALRRAMLTVRSTQPETFFWAPFILLGDPH